MLHRTFSAALFAGTIAASLPAAAHFGLILPDPLNSRIADPYLY